MDEKSRPASSFKGLGKKTKKSSSIFSIGAKNVARWKERGFLRRKDFLFSTG
ncbi:MAG: hypothetical protein LBD67_10780 [Candidatus Accumulibacter sp.]|jgi:hypothetical protein|nr:hypothetical protein [Accumulibacter sp.]